ncbi:hypothetical protein C5L32_000666, partial [Lentilactobacillus buchneri]
FYELTSQMFGSNSEELKRPAHLFVENFVQFSKVYLVAGEMNHLSRQLFKYTTLIAQSQQKLF